MNRVLVDLLAPRLIEEHLRQAEQERLLSAVERARHPGWSPAAGLGHLLVRAGGWLEASARRRSPPQPLGFLPDPCRGCAD